MSENIETEKDSPLKVVPNFDDKNSTPEDPRQGLPSSVKIETAITPLVLERPSGHEVGPWVQYNGIGTVRVITASDWRNVGCEGERVQWNYLNKKRRGKAIFSEAQLNYLLNVDGRFSLVDDNGNPVQG